MASNSKQTAERRTRNQALDLRAGQDNRRRQWTLSKDSGISASSGSQDSIDLISKKEENSAEGENVQIRYENFCLFITCNNLRSIDLLISRISNEK